MRHCLSVQSHLYIFTSRHHVHLCLHPTEYLPDSRVLLVLSTAAAPKLCLRHAANLICFEIRPVDMFISFYIKPCHSSTETLDFITLVFLESRIYIILNVIKFQDNLILFPWALEILLNLTDYKLKRQVNFLCPLAFEIIVPCLIHDTTDASSKE